MSCVSAGFLDGFFNGDSKESDNNKISFVDGGTSKNCSSDWLVLKNLSKTVTENGTVISSSNDSGVYANKPGTSLSWEDTFEWTSPFTVEFDIINWENGAHIRIIDKNNDASKSFATLGIKNGSHVKIVSTEQSLSFNVDGKDKKVINEKFTDAQIGFRLIDGNITYKNFKIH